ncbi:MAG TPA: tRNA uridine-5-carboxymethylaminomethyl(34) synthesis enzyme MnmG [Bacilli bacterium]|nr:tRNA uridine-5-carboxymethylaminomethyl(34) synthesis enzyme MnmG [Bacilli bacterium]
MYDIIVVGGGHAGCEAAHASAVMGQKTLLITSNIKNIADMPCNPSIGGTAKGIVVREIDALGGLMGKVADRTHFQIKMLNSKKGPAVRSLRAQADKKLYPKVMLEELRNTPNLTIKEGMVEDLVVENNTIKAVILDNKEEIPTKALILTTGTYLKSKILVGDQKTSSGPHGEKESKNLSDNLRKLGFEIQRLKTGTPPRIDKNTVDLKELSEEYGDKEYLTFSFDNEIFYDVDKQEKCYLVYTNENTHKIINENLDKSAMYGGYAEGIGPRYCPSIEDKIVRFKDKERHQLFLEPETKENDEWYLQGFSTSMPHDVQELMVHSLKGFEHAKINKYAYAIEYDAINPQQLKLNFETKIINNLFTAGQINGTSGYEEAAGQGLLAGINAALKVSGKEPLILKRNESYIGVLIDDLVTKGTKEPYRLLTSRAEYRLLLRHDNADLRLREYGYEAGMISKESYNKLIAKKQTINDTISKLNNTNLKLNQTTKATFINNNLDIPLSSISLAHLLKRPEIKIDFLNNFITLPDNKEILEQVEIMIKYEGYIAKANKEVEKLLNLENKIIPDDIDYTKVSNLASEALQKLSKVRPRTIAQATRISGVNPSDIAVLTVYLKKEYNKNE